MIFLWLFLLFLVLILFVLLLNLHLIFRFDEKPFFYVRILMFTVEGERFFRFFGKFSEKEADEDKTKAPKNDQKAKKRPPDLLGFAEFLAHITKIIGLALKEGLAKSKVNLKELTLVIGTQDAAKTALFYGGAIQGVNALFALLQRFSRFRYNEKKLWVSPDFTAEKSRFSIHLVVSINAVRLILLVIRTYFRLFEGKEVNYERNSVETSH